ncbi:GtrA family protein [Acinetobacter chinensis]|uniref:GtrA family protein n=1 Tax=Acinetobacter chinensis TaxID=2004650 RepID=A0ABU3WFZ0_9GAMM|nr:GtrA family protein [Acinetobacter chinensis]MDV2469326.1 GtrA family protein [Acinetobacter chinensis]
MNISSLKLAMLYAGFAILATICNILAQDICSYLYDGRFYIIISMFFGTGIGLVVKYLLDKKYIFKYKTHSLKHDSQVFTLYLMMGIFTTLIFWSFEFGFHYVFETRKMRYLGGILGLMIGYICKYYLDKRYVFRKV